MSVGSVYAGEVQIGGVNIDGRQYGGIHSSDGQITTGPIHLEEHFNVQGGRVAGYTRNGVVYPSDCDWNYYHHPQNEEPLVIEMENGIIYPNSVVVEDNPNSQSIFNSQE